LLISVQKGSFLGFARLPHLWRGTNGQDWGIVSDARRAYAALQDLKVEAARREEEFDRVGVGDIAAYNAKMPPILYRISPY
jgi:DNA segregation ATPase FtsK/SpoIIIE-like protein